MRLRPPCLDGVPEKKKKGMKASRAGNFFKLELLRVRAKCQAFSLSCLHLVLSSSMHLSSRIVGLNFVDIDHCLISSKPIDYQYDGHRGSSTTVQITFGTEDHKRLKPYLNG
jgi:hypothetical protein